MDKTTAFRIFGLDIKWYAIMIVCGMLAAMLVAGILLKRKGEKSDLVIDYAVLALPLSILGARFFYIIFSADSMVFWSLFTIWEGISWWGLLIGLVVATLPALFAVKINLFKKDKIQFTSARMLAKFSLIVVLLGLFIGRIFYLLLDDPHSYIYRLFDFRTGGLAIYGGVIGGMLGAVIVSRMKKMSGSNMLKMFDCFAPALILGQAIGRWGNYFNQEAYGQLVTDPKLQWFPLSVFIDKMGAWYQATFFYEFVLNLIGFIVLFIICYKFFKSKNGLVICGYFVWYGLCRAVIEGFRSDSLYTKSNFRVSQLLSVLFMTIALLLILRLIWKSLDLKERTHGILACAISVLCALLWTLGEIVEGMRFSIWIAIAVQMLGWSIIAFSLYVQRPRRSFAVTAGSTFFVGFLFLYGGTMLTPWLLIPAAVIGLFVVFVFPLFFKEKKDVLDDE